MPAARSRDRRAYISYPPPMPRELSNWFCPFRKTSHNYELYLHYDSSSRLRYEAPKEKRKKAVFPMPCREHRSAWRLFTSQHISSLWGRAFFSLRRLPASSYLYIENHSLGEWFKKGCCR